MYAMTSNVVDLVFCALLVVGLGVVYGYLRHQYTRMDRTMQWSPTRKHLRMVAREYHQYYRASVHQ